METMEIKPATLHAPRTPAEPALPDPVAPDPMQACRILIIDDEPANVRLLERVLTMGGFHNFISTTDPRAAVALFIDFQPDLVLTDWLMPDVSGWEVIQQLRALIGTDDYLPMVVLTADITAQTKKRALACGATDFLTKPFSQVEVILRMRNLLRTRLSHLTIQTQQATLEEKVRWRTLELQRTLEELQRSQQQIIQQERLAALGTMAGGIAHDFNNALSVIIGFGEILKRGAEHGLSREQAVPSITTLLTAAGDAARIVRRLHGFYHPDKADEPRLPVDLNRLVEQAVQLTQPRWDIEAGASGRAITVRTELGDVPWISADASELREALTNLIFNAVDALPQGGTITLGTSCAGETVALRLSDTGTGMSEEVRRHCLEPFFTTKGNEGSGLGLSMVFGILQRHGGTVEIESTLGSGTTFTLGFPMVAAKCPATLNTLLAT